METKADNWQSKPQYQFRSGAFVGMEDGGGDFGFLFELEFWKGRRAQLVPSGPSLYLIDSFLMHNKPSSMMEGPTCLHTWLLQMHAAC